jgi:hypothetical protein
MRDPRDGSAPRSAGESLQCVAERTVTKLVSRQDLFASANSWFTEGLDTPLLQEARALLEQLAP